MRVLLEGTAAQLDEVKAALFGAAPLDRDRAGWQVVMEWAAYALIATGLAGLVFGVARGAARRNRWFVYGGAGAIGMFGTIAAVLLAVAIQPELGTARFIWALAVTYLLMCALFESFIYPLVIMITVPLAVVGGFLGLKIVHDATLANPYVSTQQLDVLTMLGFIILIGIVVNNAILIVHQSLNFMRGEDGSGLSRDPLEAIAMSVKTRIRPIFMSTLTSVGGMAPLVLFPGAGSEMYRGLGSVVIGGLLVSTLFTLALTPLLLSLTLDMSRGFSELLGRKSKVEKLAEREGAPEPPALQPA
jgi:HAE1 family hydrophobic/amphiphilic exporter-1